MAILVANHLIWRNRALSADLAGVALKLEAAARTLKTMEAAAASAERLPLRGGAASETKDTISISRGALGGGYEARYKNFAALRAEMTSPEDQARWGSTAMVVQFDTRPPEKSSEEGLESYHWGSAFMWATYAAKHNHEFAFYSRPDCSGCDGRKLHSAWCKVAAVLEAVRTFPRVQLFVYTDSDATIGAAHFNHSLLDLTQDLAFAPEDDKPVMLNQVRQHEA